MSHGHFIVRKLLIMLALALALLMATKDNQIVLAGVIDASAGAIVGGAQK
jgi:hypothetical protein